MAEARKTVYVIQPFAMEKKRGGPRMTAGRPIEAQTADAARRRAQRLAEAGGAAIAFSRTGDPVAGDWDDAVILATCGTVPEEALVGIREE